MSSTARSGTSTSLRSAPTDTLGAALAKRRSQHPLIFFIGRRLVALVFLCLGVSVMAFDLTTVVPGDPAVANLGDRGSSDPTAVRLYRQHLRLDKPLPVQYFVYLGNLLHGDLGESEQSRRAVRIDLAEYIPATAELAISSMVLALLLGVTLGVLAALRRNRITDQIIRVVSLGGMSTPQFWLALVALYVFFYKLSWVPGSGRLDASKPHRGPARIRQRHDRHRIGREHLRLARDRPVLVSERDRPRPAGNRGRDALRCDCLHPRQHDRRHPLRRHRSAGRADMS